MISIRNVNLSLKNMCGEWREKHVFPVTTDYVVSLYRLSPVLLLWVCVEKSISQYKCSHNVLKDMTTTIHVPHININIF